MFNITSKKKKWLVIVFCLLVVTVTTISCEENNSSQEKEVHADSTIDYSSFDTPRYNISYDNLIIKIENFRRQQAKLYREADNEALRKEIIEVCQDSLFDYMVMEVFPAWYGTQWDFNGITQVPKKGEYPIVENNGNDVNRIACGYFATMTMHGVGLKIERYKVAWKNPEGIVKNLAKSESMFYLKNYRIEDLKAQLKKRGKGLYVVGLGPIGHVGFLVYDGKEYYRFVHSSYDVPPNSVTSDTFTSDNPLTRANDLIIGKTFSSKMIEKWLLGENFELIN